MRLFDRSSATKLNIIIAVTLGVLAVTTATDGLAAGPGERGAGRIQGGGGPAVLVPEPQTPVFNPSVPYTVPQTPESPVSPASPGSVFGNG
jgi:hypothetical protein